MSKKLQEKQQRRLAEERRRTEQQRAARRRNAVTVGVALLVTGIVVALVLAQRSQEEQQSEELTSASAQEANCGDVEEVEEEGREHVDPGTDVQYGTTPPTSGNHYAEPAIAQFYTAPVPEEQLVHNLEHSQIVIWYRANAPTEVLDAIEALVEQESAATLAAPYDGIEEPYNFVLTAWGASQACEEVSQEVVDNFRREYQGKAGPEKQAPVFEG